MLSLSRRKAPLNREGVRLAILDLPDDILILISSHCRIDELLTLTLTHSRIHNLVSQYIVTIAPAVARSTFPLSDRLLRPLDDCTQYNLAWLRGLIPQQLAAILVDRHRVAEQWTKSRYSIPAEDWFGDELRARVANGWRVLGRLSNIAHEVNSTHTKDTLRNKMLRSSRSKLHALLQKEDAILAKRVEYINSLSDQLVKDYKLMFTLLSATFSTSVLNVGSEYEPWIFDSDDGIDVQRALRRGHSWMVWFVVTEGPGLFWKQWWSLPPESSQNYVRDLALSTFRGLPSDLVDHQRALMQELQAAVNEKADARRRIESWNPFPYFTSYAHELQQRDQTMGDSPAARETMAHVPFRVDFKCPEGLLKRSAFLLQASRAVHRLDM